MNRFAFSTFLLEFSRFNFSLMMKSVFYFLLIPFSAIGQTGFDSELIKSHQVVNPELLASTRANYIFKERNAFVKYNPLSLVFGGSLFFYQRVISPQISAGCAYDVSCSNFSKQSIHRFGLVKGIALSTDRLTRCNKIASADFHPVMINDHNKVIDTPEMYKLR